MARDRSDERERLLLDEGRSLRRLARGLLARAEDADDVAQETCALALAAPPATDAFLQPWLRVEIRLPADPKATPERR